MNNEQAKTPIDLSSAIARQSPFTCFTAEQVISEQLEQELLSWLERDAPWELAIASFYEQYEFSFSNVLLPPALQPMFSAAAVTALRDNVSHLLGGTLGPMVEVTAHKLISSQTIRIHNDFRPAGETHRFLIQLNRGWREEHGGLLMLFRGPNVESIDDIIPPISRSAFGFRISRSSFHAVSKVHGGNRYTLVFSFYEESPPST